jgi:hypothetical protein
VSVAVSTAYETVNNRLNRTPVYRIRIENVTDEYSTHPIHADYADEVNADSPVGYWRLGEASGDALDSSGNGYDLTFSGGVTREQSPALVGDSDLATLFDGSTGYAELASGFSFAGKTAVTIEAWIKSDDGTWPTHGLAVSSNAGHYISVNNGKIFTSLFISSTQRTLTGVAAPTTGWHHVAVTWASGDNIRLYLDGALVKTSGVTYAGTLTTATGIAVGHVHGGAFYFDGTIDEAAIYDTQLSTVRILAHWQASRLLLNVSGIYAYMDIPKGIAEEIEPDMGRSNVSSFEFALTDIDGDVTELIGNGVGGRICYLDAGYDDLNEGEFVTFRAGIINDYELDEDLARFRFFVRDAVALTNKQILEPADTVTTAVLSIFTVDIYAHYVQWAGGRFQTSNTEDETTYTATLDATLGSGNWSFYQATEASVGTTITVTDTSAFLSAGYVLMGQEIIAYTGKTATTFTTLTRGALGTAQQFHPAGAAVRELFRLGPDHPLDLLQALYTNTDKTGLSISAGLVDATAIDAVKTSIGAYEMEFRITAPVNAKEFIEREILKPLACYPKVTAGGKLSVVESAEPASGDSVASLDHDSIVADDDGKRVIQWKGNFQSVINQVTVRYDWNPVTNEFESTYEDEDGISIAAFGKHPRIIESKGLRSSLTDTDDLITARVDAILDRYAATAPIVTIRTFLQKQVIEPGDIISLTSALIPNRYTKARGITDVLYEVVRRELLFDQGYVDFDLLWTSFPTLSKDDFNRADSVVDDDYAIGNDWEKNESDLGALRIVSNELYAGIGEDPGTSAHGFAYRPETIGNDQISELTFRAMSGAPGSGPAVRLDSGGGFLDCTGYAATYRPVSGGIFLKKYFGTNLTSSLGTTLDSYVTTLVDGDRVRIRARGATITVYVNDVSVIEVTDVAITGGRVGALTNSSSGNIDWDDWRGGDAGWA